MILGLDFLRASRMTIKPHLNKYSLQDGKEFSFLSQPSSPLQWTSHVPTMNFYLAVDDSIGLEPPSCQLTDAQPEIVRPLLRKWSSVWTENKGVTSLLKHTIQTVDEVPVRQRAYSVPAKAADY